MRHFHCLVIRECLGEESSLSHLQGQKFRTLVWAGEW